MGRAEPQHRPCSHQPSGQSGPLQPVPLLSPMGAGSRAMAGLLEQPVLGILGNSQPNALGHRFLGHSAPGGCHKDLFLCQATALVQKEWKGAEVLPHGMLAQLALLRSPARCRNSLESFPAPVLTGPQCRRSGGPAREKVLAGSERQSQILHTSRVPAFFFSQAAFAVCWVRVISLSQQQWLALVACPDGTWKGCTAEPLQGAEIPPGSKIPLGKLRGPAHAVLPTWG